MQIGTKNFYQSQINGMADLQTKIGRIQEEVSTGKKLLAPSDDPGAYTVADRLTQTIASMDQYGRNIGMAKARLSQEDTVLTSASNIIARLNELGVQGANSTNDEVARLAISQEMTQLSEQLVALGNSVDANGDYLFAGYKSDHAPFSFDAASQKINYNGDTGRKDVELAKGIATPTSSNGLELFMNVGRSGNQTVSIFDIINNATAALNNNENVPDSVLSDLKGAIDHFSTYQAICGSRLQKVETADANRLAQLTNVKSTLSTIQDADLAQLASDLQQKSLTLQAAQSVFAKISQLTLFNFIK
jgi:flagellar hook-associated protein 3 FlgL